MAVEERSSRFWIILMVRITHALGNRVGQALLYPISLFFLLTNRGTYAASKRFFRKALGHEPRFSDFFRQYHTFASTLFDRMQMLTRPDLALKMNIHGLEDLERASGSGSGCLLVGSHLGSFDIIRMIGKTQGGIKVKIVMFGEATPQIFEVFKSLNPELHEDIVSVPGPSAMIGLAADRDEGRILGLLGDRVLPGERTIRLPFFGETATFATTAGYVADILELPVIQFFCLHKAWGEYDIHFIPLSWPTEASRGHRSERIESLTTRYAANLEYHARKAPHNWFNFHDFWAEPSQ